MPRDSSGNYTLPVGNPVVDGTTIDTTWANPTMSDIALQLNNVLTRDGLLGPLAPLYAIDGTEALPGYAFASQHGTGLWKTTGNMHVSVGGVEKFRFNIDFNQSLTQFQAPAGTPALPGYAFVGNPDTGMFYYPTNLLGFSTAGVTRGLFKSVPGFHIGDSNVDSTATSIALYNRSRIEGAGTTQYGYQENSMFGTPTVTAAYGAYIANRFADGAYVTNVYTGLRVIAPALGTGHTLNTTRGVQLDDFTGTVSVTGIYSAITSGTSKWFIFSTGDAASTHSGQLLVGTATLGDGKLRVFDTLANCIEITNSVTNNATKAGSIAIPRYATADTSFTLIRGTSGATDNNVTIGGGSSALSCATQILLYTGALSAGASAGTERMRIWADGRISGTAIHNNAGSVAGTTNQFIASGTYLPVVTAVSNVASTIPSSNTMWIRVGNVVTVSGYITVDPTAAATSTVFWMTLPIPSAIASIAQLAGSGTFNESGVRGAASVFGRAADDAAEFSFYPNGLAAAALTFVFSYLVI